MSGGLMIDEELVRRLPLPLAQLYRRAHNAKTPYECHQAAYYLWETALKLLACVAIVEYDKLPQHDPELEEQLKRLSRPALGDWWSFVRRLVPVLADTPVEGFEGVRDYLLGRQRDDLPRAAGLDAALREDLEGQSSPRTTVRLMELFDRLVRYRNIETGHGAAGLGSTDRYSRMGRAMVLGIAEILERLDLLAGRRLLYIGDIRKLTSGRWLVEQFELVGESPRRLESSELADDEHLRALAPQSVYFERSAPPAAGSISRSAALESLQPLLLYDFDSNEFLFLNTTRGKRRSEYVCYTSGRVLEREGLVAERRAMLSHILARDVDPSPFENLPTLTHGDEPQLVSTAPVPDRRSIGEYELLSRIGQGAMGIVYRAWQPSLGRQVALKSLLRMGDPKAEARFRREIQALGRVEHPHLVKIFTSGSDGDQWFYTMELIEGADLGSVCTKLGGTTSVNLSREDWERAVSTAVSEARQSEQPLSVDRKLEPRPSFLINESGVRIAALTSAGHIQQVVELVRQVALAAAALHEAGVVHRDIKPGNIMVIPGTQHAVLMDLGLAQLADESEGRLTRTRQFVGTLRYASPEQVLAVGKLDRRSDIYSLGASLYELLTLQPLFGATDDTPTHELMLKIQSSEPQRPSRLNPRIPRDLDAIVLKCLEKDPGRRYGTARELAGDLERWERGDPVMAQPPTLRYFLGKYMRRNRLRIAVSAVALLAAIGATAFEFHRINRDRSEAVKARQEAELAREQAQAREKEVREERVRAELALVDASVVQALAQSRPDPHLVPLLFAALHKVPTGPTGRNLVTGINLAIRRHDPSGKVALPLWIELAKEQSPNLRTLAFQGLSNYNAGEAGSAISLARASLDDPDVALQIAAAKALCALNGDPYAATLLLDHLKNSTGQIDVNVIKAIFKRPELVSLLSERLAAAQPNTYEEAVIVQGFNDSAWLLATDPDPERRNPHRAVELAKKAVERSPDTAAFWNTLGAGYYRAGDWNAAIDAFGKSMDLLGGGASSDWYFLAMSYWRLGEKERARKWFAAAELWTARYGAKDEELLRFRTEAARDLELPLPALSSKPTELAIVQALVEANPTATSYQRRGSVYADLRQWDKAADDFAKSITLGATNFNPWYERALVLLANNDRHGYQSACQELMNKFGKSRDVATADFVAWTCALAPEALADLTPAVTLAEYVVQGNPQSAQYVDTLGAILYRAGRFKDALAKLEKAFALAKKLGTASALAYTEFYLAMAHHRLQHASEARDWFKKACNDVDISLKSQKPGNPNLRWNRRITLAILRKEADTLLANAATQPPRTQAAEQSTKPKD